MVEIEILIKSFKENAIKHGELSASAKTDYKLLNKIMQKINSIVKVVLKNNVGEQFFGELCNDENVFVLKSALISSITADIDTKNSFVKAHQLLSSGQLPQLVASQFKSSLEYLSRIK